MKGFSLIELIVSVAIFSIVVLLAAGDYLVVISATRQAQATATAADNLAYAFESMARTIRTGSLYVCNPPGPPDNCGFPNGSGSIMLTDDNKNTVGYRLTDANGNPTTSIREYIRDPNNNIIQNYASITDPSVIVQSLRFSVEGADFNDGKQPQVLIQISGYLRVSQGKQLPFYLETGATARSINS